MFQIFDVPPGAAEITEQLGTKYKFWFTHPQYGLTLFKEGRPNTGENWAERLACELALMLGLPHAVYELARYDGRFGVITPNFVDRGGRLIHGNELLAKAPGAEVREDAKNYHAQHHKLPLVLSFMKILSPSVGLPQGATPIHGVNNVLDMFVGYIMFDAWIANQDRHDQNWGLIRYSQSGDILLAPSFDHGSALARNLLDAKREVIMATRDQGQNLAAFAKRAKSAFYPGRASEPGERVKTISTIDACAEAFRTCPTAGAVWKKCLTSISDEMIDSAVDLIPDEVISDIARTFTKCLLKFNRATVLDIPTGA